MEEEEGGRRNRNNPQRKTLKWHSAVHCAKRITFKICTLGPMLCRGENTVCYVNTWRKCWGFFQAVKMKVILSDPGL